MSKKIRFLIAFFAVCLSLCSACAYADPVTEMAEDDGVSKHFYEYYANDITPSVTSGENSIDYVNGMVNSSVVDLSLPGKNGLDLNVVRRFSSQETKYYLVYDKYRDSEKLRPEYKAYYYNYEIYGIEYTILVAFDTEYDMVDEFYCSMKKSELENRIETDDVGNDYLLYKYINDTEGDIHFVRDKSFECVEIENLCYTQTVEESETSSNIEIKEGWEMLVPSLVIDWVNYSDSTNRPNRGYAHFQDEYGRQTQIKYFIQYDYDYHYFHIDNESIKSDDLALEITEEIDSDGTLINYVNITDAYGKKYVFRITNLGSKESVAFPVSWIEDRYGNKITYEKNSERSYTINDTYGRRVELSNWGISVYEGNSLLKKIDYDYEITNDEERDPSGKLDFLKKYKLKVKKYTNDTDYEETVYVMRRRDIRVNREYVYLTQYLLESCEYPEGRKEEYVYETDPTYEMTVMFSENVVNRKYYLGKVVKKMDYELENGEYALKKTDNIAYEVTDKEDIYSIFLPYVKATVDSEYPESEPVKTVHYYDAFGKENQIIVRDSSGYMVYSNSYEDDIGASKPNEVSESGSWVYRDSNLLMSRKTYTGEDNYGRTHSYDLEYSGYKYDDKKRPVSIKEGSTFADLVLDDKYGFVLEQTVIKDGDTKIKTVNTKTEDGLSIANTSVYEVKDEETLCSSVDYTYNPDGTVSSEKINNGDEAIIRQYTYNYDENKASYSVSVSTAVKDIDGNSSTITETVYYDGLGNVVKTVDGNGNAVEYVYDMLGRKITEKNPDGTEVSVDYANALNEITVTDEQGYKITYDYNSHGGMEKVYLPDEDNTLLAESSYDSKYRKTDEYVYKDNTNYVRTQYEYDELDRVTKETVRDKSKIIDQAEYEHELSYILNDIDGGEYVRQTKNLFEALVIYSTTGSYDDDNYVTVTVDGQTRLNHQLKRDNPLFEIIDVRGSQNVTISAGDNFIKYRFIGKGDMSPSLISASNKVEVSYMDDAEQIRPDEEHTYNGAGLLTYKIYYYQRNRILNKEGYEYDCMGNVERTARGRVYMESFDNYVTKSEYDYAGRLVKQYNLEDNYITNKYDMAGRMIESTDEAGKTTYYTYDSLGRVIKIVSPFGYGDTTEKLLYYDGAGNVIREKQLIDDADGVKKYSVTEYEYDEMNRPIWIKTNDGTRDLYSRYKYDEKGNVTEVVTGMYTKTEEGVPEEAAARAYSYDRFSNVIKVEEGIGKNTASEEGTCFTYEYNLVGEKLVERKRDGHEIRYTYDSAGNVIKIENDDEEDDILIEYNCALPEKIDSKKLQKTE